MDISLISYVIVCFVLAITPGPDMVLITRNTLSHSNKGGMVTALGTCTSLLFYSFLTAFGLTYFIKSNQIIYLSIKYLGASYLLYLGMHTLYMAFQKFKSPLDFQDLEHVDVPYKKLYIQGFLTNLLNPKIIILYLSILPQFVSIESAGFISILSYAFINIAIGMTWLYCYILMLHKLRERFLIPKIRQRLEEITGIILVILGFSMLFGE